MTVKIGDTTYLYGENEEHKRKFWKAVLLNLLKQRYVSNTSFDQWWNVLLEKVTK